MALQMRVRRFSSKTKFESRQFLQVKRWWGWSTIDREDIPHHVLVSLGAFGDRGGWVSKFAELGAFGSDGKFTPHDPSKFEGKLARAAAAFKRIVSLFVPFGSREASV